MARAPAQDWKLSIFVPEPDTFIPDIEPVIYPGTAAPKVKVGGKGKNAGFETIIPNFDLISNKNQANFTLPNKPFGWFGGGKVSEVDGSVVQRQWTQTIAGIVKAVNEWSDTAKGNWDIDEVNFGLTLNGEGKLLFIAKAGAEASVQIKIKRAKSGRGKSRA